MKRLLAALTLLLIGAAPLGARAQVSAPSFGSAAAARIDHLAKLAVHAGHAPGLAVGVVEDGRLVFVRGYGFANLAKHIPVGPDTEFAIGRLTESFTAAAVLLLVQDGKLKLTDDVTRYVPELTLAKDVTVDELLEQTSGLPDFTKAPGIDPDQTRQVKLADLLHAVNGMQLVTTPGTTYAENDLNYILAGLIVERVSNLTLSDFLAQRIFVPLVMDHTFYAGDTGIAASHALGYARTRGGFGAMRPLDPSWLLGARGMVSSVTDLAKWDIEMPILLRVDAVREMFAPSAQLGPTHYGMGWVIDARGGKRFVWSSGALPGFQAANLILPDDHVAAIVLANASATPGAPGVASDLAARVLDITAPSTTVRLDNAVLERARAWLHDIAIRRIDRTELTPAFSAYLTDQLVEQSDFAALGKLQSIVPISSETEANGDTLYEFLVTYPHARYHYKLALTREGKVDEILLEP